MATANPYILLEMSDEPDCRIVAAWLTKVAEAQALWLQALNDHRFADHVRLLHADGTPDLAAAALEILGELEHHCHVAALNLNSDENVLVAREFGLLVQLGLFVVDGPSYWMAIPEEVTLTAVKLAAFDVLSTAKDSADGVEVIQPERQLYTLSAFEAEAWRLTLILMRRLGASSTYRHRQCSDDHMPPFAAPRSGNFVLPHGGTGKVVPARIWE